MVFIDAIHVKVRNGLKGFPGAINAELLFVGTGWHLRAVAQVDAPEYRHPWPLCGFESVKPDRVIISFAQEHAGLEA